MAGDVSVIAVGSPIIDLIARVEEDFLNRVPGEKGGMVMIGSEQLEEILALLNDDVKRFPGGSAANTIFDLAHFGVRTALLGTVGNDEAGIFYRKQRYPDSSNRFSPGV